ncbi:MAG: hypothetical protein WA323_06360 [Candidatus Nitrosopolaris sp.]
MSISVQRINQNANALRTNRIRRLHLDTSAYFKTLKRERGSVYVEHLIDFSLIRTKKIEILMSYWVINESMK